MFTQWYFRIRDMLRFSGREQREIFISAILFGFIVSFKMWGGESFNANEGVTNWIISSILVLIMLLWNLSFQKAFALHQGYKAQYYAWFPGIFIGVLLVFISFGTLWVFFPGTSYYEHEKKMRLGEFRHGVNNKNLVVPAIAGVYSNVILALILSFIYVATQSYWTLMFIKINLLYAFFSLIPIPKIEGTQLGEGATAGFYMFFFKRQMFVFVAVSVLAYSALIYFAATALASFLLLILALIIGLIVMFIFLKFSEGTI